MLSDKIEYYKKNKKMLRNTPAQYKKDFDWLKEVDSLALVYASNNLNQAFQNFFKRPEIGFPNFKSKKNHRQTYTTYNNHETAIRIENNKIRLPKIKFVKIKGHKADWYGREIIKIDTFFPSSQICSNCGCIDGKKDLSIREWTCPHCGTHLDRDVNAAQNILKEGLNIKNTGGQ